MLSLKEKVSKAEAAMMKGEKIFYQGEPKKSTIILKAVINPLLIFVIIWLIIDGAVIGFLLSSSDWGLFMIFIFGFFILHLTPVWIYLAMVIKAYLKSKKLYYVVTNFRVMAMNKKDCFDSLYYKDISDVEIMSYLTNKITHTTTIKISINTALDIDLQKVNLKKADYMYLLGVENGADIFEMIYARKGKFKEELQQEVVANEITSKRIKKIKKKVK